MENAGFPANLRALRKAHHMTQSDVAEAVGVNRVTVSLWESGKIDAPRNSATTQRLCEVFGVTERELLGFADGYLESTAHRQNPVEVLGGGVHWVSPAVLEAHPDGVCVRVPDDAASLIVPAGAYVFAAPEHASEGALVVAAKDERTLIGRIHYEGEMAFLVPCSTHLTYPVRSLDGCTLLGRVVWVDYEAGEDNA